MDESSPLQPPAASAPEVGCPRCGAALAPGSPACQACGLPLTGRVAGLLWDVDQQLVDLRRRRSELLERLAAGEGVADRAAASTSSPEAVTAVAAGAGRSAVPFEPEHPAGSGPERHGAQRLLLVAGVVLVTASAVGLGALAVARLGALGQLAVLAVLVAAALLASLWSRRRGLGASAESFAVLAVALAITGLASARSRGLVSDAAVTDRWWPVLVLASLCLLSALAAATLRRGGRPMAFGWAALATGALLPAALAIALERGPALTLAVLLAAAVLAPLAGRLLASHGAAATGAALLVAIGHLVAGFFLVLAVLADRPTAAESLGLAGVLAGSALAARLWARRGSTVSPSAAAAGWPLAAAAAGGAAVAAASAGGDVALVVVAAAAALVAAVVVVLGRGAGRRALWAAAATAQGVAAASLLLTVAGRGLYGDDLAAPGAWAAWAALALAAGLTAVRAPAPHPSRGGAPTDPPAPPPAAVLAWCGVSAAATLAAAGAVETPTPRTIALLLAASLAAVLAALVRRGSARTAPDAAPGALPPTVEALLGATWALAALLAVLVSGGAAIDGGPPGVPVETVLALAGAQALAYALLPGRAPARVLGVLLLVAAAAVVEPAPPRVLALLLVATLAAALAAQAARAARAGGSARSTRPVVPARSPAGAEPARRGTAEQPAVEALLVTAWALAVLLALVDGGSALLTGGLDGRPRPSASSVPAEAVLGVAGIQALAYSLLPGRALARVLGVVAVSLAWWTWLGGEAFSDGAPVELWSLPPAALALVVGALTWRIRPVLSSWAAIGTGLAAALAPSTVASFDAVVPTPGLSPDPWGEQTVRAVVVVVVGVVLVVAGVRRGWQAPVVLGALAALVVGAAQIGPYVTAAPLWLTTGLAGVGVLALAVRLEAARRSSARALGWLRALR